MFPDSIRWRWQLWLAFLLATVLTGFGVSVYQLQRVTQLKQIDEELERRIAVLSRAVRGGPPPFEGGRSGAGFDDGFRRPPPLRPHPDFPPPGGGRELRFGPRDFGL